MQGIRRGCQRDHALFLAVTIDVLVNVIRLLLY